MKPDSIARLKAEFSNRLKAAGEPKGFRAEKKDTSGALYIYDVIGADYWTGEGVTAKSVAEKLDELKDVKTLNVYINSPGGLISDGKAIYSQLKRFPATKNVYIDGVAASAATFIAMAGDKIVTGAAATWMIHEAMGGAYGYAEDLEATASVLRMLTNDVATIYAARTGKSKEQCLAWMAEETWMDAATALERGFTDEVTEDEDAPGEAEAVAVPMFKAIEETRARPGFAAAIADLNRSRFLHSRNAASRGATPGQPGSSTNAAK